MIKKIASNKLALILTSLLAVGLVSAAVYVKATQTEADKQAQEEPKTDTDQENLAEAKKDAPVIEKTDPGSGDTPATPAPSKKQITPVITTLELNDDRTSVIVGGLPGDVSSGNCTVTLTKNGQSNVVRTVPIVLVTRYYACQDLYIEKSAFPSLGEWSAKITVSTDAAEGTSAAKTISLD